MLGIQGRDFLDCLRLEKLVFKASILRINPIPRINPISRRDPISRRALISRRDLLSCFHFSLREQESLDVSSAHSRNFRFVKKKGWIQNGIIPDFRGCRSVENRRPHPEPWAQDIGLGGPTYLTYDTWSYFKKSYIIVMLNEFWLLARPQKI